MSNSLPSRRWDARRLVGVSLLRNAEYASYVLATLAVTPILYRYLGAVDYGVWLLLISQVPLIRLFDPGIHQILLNTVIDRRVREDLRSARDVVANGLRLALGICLVVSAVILLSGSTLLGAIGIDLSTVNHERILLLAPVTMFVSGMLGGVTDAVLFGMNRFGPSSIAGMIANTLNAFLSAVLVLWGFGLLAVAVCAIITQLILLVAKFTLVRMLVPEIPISTRRVDLDRTAWDPLLQIGPWSMLIAVSWVIGYNTDNLVVGSVLSLSILGSYAVSQRLPNALRTTLQMTFSVLFPYTSELHSRDDQQRIRSAVLFGTKAATSIGFLIILVLWDLGPQLLNAWVGPIEDGAFLLRLGLAANIMFAIRVIPDNVLFAAGAVKYLAIVVLISAIANIGLSIGFTQVVGSSGPLLGSIITGLVTIVVLARRIARLAGLGIAAYTVESIGRPTIAAVPAVGVLIGSHLMGLTDGVFVVTVAAIVGIVYLVCGGAFVLVPSEREMLRRRLVPIFHRQ